MHVSLTIENLSRALSVVGRAVSARSSLPVLSNVLLSTDQNRVKLSATNLELGINYWIGGKIESEGSITVPARLFSEFVSNLPSGNIELKVSDTVLNVHAAHYESQINGISADEFPLIPKLSTAPVLTMPVESFREAVQQVVIAASIDEARPVLAGVYMFVEKGELVMAATDSYRLAERKISLKGLEANDKLSVIVPARTMQELVRILGDAEGELKVYLNENQIMFEVDNIELTSRLIEGQFPNYQQIIPSSTETSFEIPTSEFSRIVKVANLFARENASSIKIEVKEDGQISVLSTASQIGENTSTAECEVRGVDNEISLNAKYLSDALSVINSKTVNFSISGKLNPCVLQPSDDTEAEYLHIIMPLRT